MRTPGPPKKNHRAVEAQQGQTHQQQQLLPEPKFLPQPVETPFHRPLPCHLFFEAPGRCATKWPGPPDEVEFRNYGNLGRRLLPEA